MTHGLFLDKTLKKYVFIGEETLYDDMFIDLMMVLSRRKINGDPFYNDRAHD